MKNLTALLFIISMLSGSGCSENLDSNNNSALQTLHDKNIHLEDLKQQWVIINYWATWCSPCREEIPELNELQKENPHIKVIGVNYDKLTLSALIQESTKMGIEFDVLTKDPSSLLAFNRPNVLPTTLIFSPQLKLHKSLKGPQTKKDILDAIHIEKRMLNSEQT